MKNKRRATDVDIKTRTYYWFSADARRCATTVPDAYTEPKAGFTNVSNQTSIITKKGTAFAETQA